MTWNPNMDEAPRDGGPAFGHGDHKHGGDPGMSLRDWFAGQALAGMLANNTNEDHILEFAEVSYQFADAMLAVRSSQPPETSQ